jgi:cation diffusion facilitator CzcD-associated flavoprotein CzcO
MQAVTHLRSPKELDFSLGRCGRSLARYAEGGAYPLANVYSLEQAQDRRFNESTTPAQRADRRAFWRYANALAKASGADRYVLEAKVEALTPARCGWQLRLSSGDSYTSAVVILATGLMNHLYLPQPWLVWWRQLPADRRHHALSLNYEAHDFAGKRVAVLGSSNIATWEAALHLAGKGATVTLLSRYANPVEWQLPFAADWFRAEFMKSFMKLPSKVRLRMLKKTHVPATALPGMAAAARAAGVRTLHHARVHYATSLWGGVQLHYKTAAGEQVAQFDHVVAATGVAPRIKALPFLQEAAQQAKAPVVVSGPARYRPTLDDAGRWKNLPPLYPMGAFALTRAGLAAGTLASAVVYLPLCMPDILRDAGVDEPADVLNAA